MRHPSELVDVFRANGRKVTAQRQCIFGVLYGDATHPTAEAVHEAARRQMETISLKTVYQTLHELASLGEIAALDVGTGTTRFDPNAESVHHHLVCRSCGKVRDVHADFSAIQVPAGGDAGFAVGPAEAVARQKATAKAEAVARRTVGPAHHRTGSVSASPSSTSPSSVVLITTKRTWHHGRVEGFQDREQPEGSVRR